MSDTARSQTNQDFLDSSFLQGTNAVYLEQMAAAYARDPSSVPESWRAFLAAVNDAPSEASASAEGPSWKRDDWPVSRNGDLTTALGDIAPEAMPEEKVLTQKVAAHVAQTDPAVDPEAIKVATRASIRAIMMIRAFRVRGHLAAQLDPLGISSFGTQPELEPETYGFEGAALDKEIFIDGYLGLETATPRQMLEILRRNYCGPIGVEFMHISNMEEKAWMQERFEGADKAIRFSAEGKKAILAKLVETERFEQFLHKRYPGTKRFGADGGESMVPALEQVIKRGGAMGVEDVIIGMPHRGRLNVLGAVMGKPYHQIFHEFQGGNTQGEDEFGSGDVKYHLGASSDREFDGNKVHLSLTANPSHLEAVDPVVLGKARAKQEKNCLEKPGTPRMNVLPLLLHGDAAFAG